MPLHPSRTPAALLLPLLVFLAGCHVSSDGKRGDNNVNVATPFGGLQIKTNEAAAQAAVGLPTYPGSQPIKNDHGADHDSGAADINMSFGSFQMRVKALSFRTPDSPDKVQAFYRNALRRYGDIVACVDDHPVGTPTRTAEGLTCDKDGHDASDSSDAASAKKIELKTGSEKHQHTVSIEPEGGGTKFALVALDLPGHISIGNDQSQPQD